MGSNNCYSYGQHDLHGLHFCATHSLGKHSPFIIGYSFILFITTFGLFNLVNPLILCEDKMGGVSQPLYASDYDSLAESYCRLGGGMTPGLERKIDI